MSTSPTDSPKDGQFGISLILEPLKLITWLGASAGGLTVLLAATGFLVVHGESIILGSPYLQSNVSRLVQLGFLFYYHSLTHLVAGMLTFWQLVLFVVLIAAYLTIARCARGTYRVRLICLYVSVVAVIVAEVVLLLSMSAPFEYRGLLFKDFGNGLLEKTSLISRMIRGDEYLIFRHARLTLAVVGLAVLIRCIRDLTGELQGGSRTLIIPSSATLKTILGSRRRATWIWNWGRIVVFALLLLCIVLLPMQFGATTLGYVRPIVKHIVLASGVDIVSRVSCDEAAKDQDPQMGMSDKAARADTPDDERPEKTAEDQKLPHYVQLKHPVYYLGENENSIIVYCARDRAVATVKMDSIEQYVISGPEPLFGKGEDRCTD